MTICEMIKTVIIDDNKVYLDSLKEHLSFFPEIELQGFATQYSKAINLLTKTTPDLVFLDIEMPGKNGFELLAEARKTQKSNFSVIFYTAFDKYLLSALRESAFDYILKPINPQELRSSIERYKLAKGKISNTLHPACNPLLSHFNDIISLPTNTGLKFMSKNAIILFQCLKESLHDKPCWKALLTDNSQVKLRIGTTAKEILDFMGDDEFAQINQSTIININYLGLVEYKTRQCMLVPPFKNIHLIASRTQLSEIKEKFDFF